jgi:hypothetical protein
VASRDCDREKPETQRVSFEMVKYREMDCAAMRFLEDAGFSSPHMIFAARDLAADRTKVR